MAALTMIPVHLHQELHDRIQANALDDGLSLAHYIATLLDQNVPRPA
jgi:predicted HicB family RNase H-like nuclease